MRKLKKQKEKECSIMKINEKEIPLFNYYEKKGAYKAQKKKEIKSMCIKCIIQYIIMKIRVSKSAGETSQKQTNKIRKSGSVSCNRI